MQVKLKRAIMLLLVAAMVLSVFAGCKDNKKPSTSDESSSTYVELPSEPVFVEPEVSGELGQITVKRGETIDDLMLYMEDNQLVSADQTVKVYDADGNEVTDISTFLENGMTVSIVNADGEKVKSYELLVVDPETEVDSSGNFIISSTPSGTPSGGASTTPSNTTSGNSSISTSVTKDPVTLIIWGDKSNQSLALAINAYTKQHTNVTIEVTLPPNASTGATSIDQLKLAKSAGTAVDVVSMDQAYIIMAGEDEYIHDLNQLGASSIKNLFTKTCWDSVSYGKETYGIPFDANTIAQCYNIDIFNNAGVSTPPSNYAELKTVAGKVLNHYPDFAPYTFPTDWSDKNWRAFNYFFWLWRCGGDVLSSNRLSATFNSAAGVQALQMLCDLKKDRLISDSYKHNEFFSGTVGIMDIGSWTYKSMFTSEAQAKFGATLLPELKAGVPRYSGLGLYAYCVTQNSKNPAVAYDFIKFYCSSKDYQLAYCQNAHLMPSLLSAQNDSYYQTGAWKTFFRQLELSKYRPSVQYWSSIEANVADSVTRAISGQVTPKEALDASAAYANRMIERAQKNKK